MGGPGRAWEGGGHGGAPPERCPPQGFLLSVEEGLDIAPHRGKKLLALDEPMGEFLGADPFRAPFPPRGTRGGQQLLTSPPFLCPPSPAPGPAALRGGHRPPGRPGPQPLTPPCAPHPPAAAPHQHLLAFPSGPCDHILPQPCPPAAPPGSGHGGDPPLHGARPPQGAWGALQKPNTGLNRGKRWGHQSWGVGSPPPHTGPLPSPPPSLAGTLYLYEGATRPPPPLSGACW